jgi:S1-C subfamily serine protease
MKKIQLIILRFVIFSFCVCGYLGITYLFSNSLHQNQNLSTYDYLTSVTVRILQIDSEDETRGSIGTGTIIKIKNGYTYILTNRHVAPISNPDGIYVVINENEKYNAIVIDSSEVVDLSLIKINTVLKNKRAIRGFNIAKPGEKAYNVGMYLGNFYIYSDGAIGGEDEENNLIVSMPSAFGNSGSGVFNNKGQLIAVIFAGYRLNFVQTDTSRAVCVKIENVRLFLNNIDEWRVL